MVNDELISSAVTVLPQEPEVSQYMQWINNNDQNSSIHNIFFIYPDTCNSFGSPDGMYVTLPIIPRFTFATSVDSVCTCCTVYF
jgi:hypothetical protein